MKLTKKYKSVVSEFVPKLLLFALCLSTETETCVTRIPNRPTTDPFRYPYYLNPFNYPTLVPIRYKRSAGTIECGRPKVVSNLERLSARNPHHQRHVDLSEALANSWPWVAGLYVVNNRTISHRCSGTLIDSTHVITSAHCLVGLYDSRLLVSLGTSRLVSDIHDSALKSVEKMHVHEDYPRNTNDLAIIKLSKSVQFTDSIRPVCLPNDPDPKRIFDKHVVVTGWGRIQYNSSVESASVSLRQAVLKIKNDRSSECNTPRTIGRYCAKSVSNDSANICWSDLGAPLVFLSNKTWFLYGVLSGFKVDRTNSMCDLSAPTLYSMIPNYLKWIEKNLN